MSNMLILISKIPYSHYEQNNTVNCPPHTSKPTLPPAAELISSQHG